MMWGKIPKVKGDDKRNRCSQIIMRDQLIANCTRLARGCKVSKNGFVLNECMMLCGSHQRHLLKKGFTLTILDMRKKARGEAQ